MSKKEKTQWWDLLDRHIEEVRAILRRFNPKCLETFETQYKKRDFKVWWHLQTAWENAPDKAWIHEIPGWHVFCDLCSDAMFG